MTLTRQTALSKLHEWTENPSLLKHARAVEIVMREAAGRYGGQGADADRWALVGLLHDADYDRWPEEHPQRVVDWLREQGEEELAYAVAAHKDDPSVPPNSPLDKALLACDELAGFVMACSLVRPDGVSTLTPKSVKKKLKDKAFAAKVDRDVIYRSVEVLGADLTEHVAFVIDALRPHAEELEITGSGS